jgi:hypothetical protein
LAGEERPATKNYALTIAMIKENVFLDYVYVMMGSMEITVKKNPA